jgi:integrase
MGRPKKNALELSGNATEGFRLRGHINGKRFRLQSYDLGKLESIKNREEAAFAALHEAVKSPRVLRLTELSEAQLRDAEAACRRAAGVPLLDCVIAAERVLPKVKGAGCEAAREEWIAELRQRGRRSRTLKKNEARISAFLAFNRNPKLLSELVPEMAHRWVFRGTKGYTALTDATTLLAWFRWCVKKKKLAVLPFDIDMRDLAERSRTVTPARILTPGQVAKILEVAAGEFDGKLLPYTVLTGWLRLRHSEAIRTTAQMIKLQLPVPVVEVSPLKRRTASYRQVPIPANMLPFLRAAVERGAFNYQPPPPKRRPGRPPKNNRKPRPPGPYWTKRTWAIVREKAGIVGWQENLLRHTGISYHFQKCGDIREVCREAGNTAATSFRHYLTLPEQGAAAVFFSDELVAPALRTYLR